MTKLATAAVGGFDANHFGLTVGKLIAGSDIFFLENPLEAKEYEVELKSSLVNLKDGIMANAETGAGDSFEL